ncbi:MAG: hypothetical protein O3A95_02250 [Planctomycetota bacterium]|nr:hypothetical protein [Planctomycetota bacterium]MDA1113105.1 hypothetical protein [Planctomycetota bacterium]
MFDYAFSDVIFEIIILGLAFWFGLGAGDLFAPLLNASAPASEIAAVQPEACIEAIQSMSFGKLR